MNLILGDSIYDHLKQNSESLTYGSVGPALTQNGKTRPNRASQPQKVINGAKNTHNEQNRAVIEPIVGEVMQNIWSVMIDVQNLSHNKVTVHEESERVPEDITDPNCHSSNNDLLFSQNWQGDRQESHNMVTGANNPNVVPEFLTARPQSQLILQRPEPGHNASLDSTVPMDAKSIFTVLDNLSHVFPQQPHISFDTRRPIRKIAMPSSHLIFLTS